MRACRSQPQHTAIDNDGEIVTDRTTGGTYTPAVVAMSIMPHALGCLGIAIVIQGRGVSV
jgi:hypothetical protein